MFVEQQLDSVNVFIFPALRFKKWSLSSAPGCTLSCLKRSDYLLRASLGGLGGFDHQLITKSQKGAIHQKLMALSLMNNSNLQRALQEVRSVVTQAQQWPLKSWTQKTNTFLSKTRDLAIDSLPNDIWWVEMDCERKRKKRHKVQWRLKISCASKAECHILSLPYHCSKKVASI